MLRLSVLAEDEGAETERVQLSKEDRHQFWLADSAS